MSVELDRQTDRQSVPVRLIPMDSKHSKRKKTKRLKRNKESDDGNTRIVYLIKVNEFIISL